MTDKKPTKAAHARAVKQAEAVAGVNPQDGHEGRIGHTDEVACPNCGKVVSLTVKDGKVRCPKCPLVEDATGLRIPVNW